MKSQRQGGFLIAKIHQLGGRIFARILKENNIDEINPAQGRIMFVLWRNNDIPIAKLARQTSLGKSTLTSMLDRLEKSGYLRREPSPDDRREILIKRTKKDKAMQKTYVLVSQEMNKLFYAGFSDSEIDEFEGYLKRAFENLEGIKK
jgi:DNA-binding MarR family transcriptional regulator